MATPKIARPRIIIFLEPTRSIKRPKKDVVTVKERKYVVAICPIVAEEAPIPFSKSGISGATKLIPKASKKTVNNIGRSPLSITAI